jgi:hypothetical protein
VWSRIKPVPGQFHGSAANLDPEVRTDSASFLSERQRIVSVSAFQAESASPRIVSAQRRAGGGSSGIRSVYVLPYIHVSSGSSGQGCRYRTSPAVAG